MGRSKTLIMVVGLLIIGGVVAMQLSHPSAVQAQRGCTAQTLRGTYGLHFQGWFYDNGPGSTRAPAAQIGVGFFDGLGNMSTETTSSFNGSYAGSQTLSFTYQVNSNCTGSATPDSAGSGSGAADFVIVDGGKQLLILGKQYGSSPAMVWSGVAIRQ